MVVEGEGLGVGSSEHHQSHFTDEEAEPQDNLDTVAMSLRVKLLKQAFKESWLCAKHSG